MHFRYIFVKVNVTNSVKDINIKIYGRNIRAKYTREIFYRPKCSKFLITLCYGYEIFATIFQ